MNKLQCIDDIIKCHGSHIQYVDDNPDYVIPVGLPNINLELRTAKVVELYVLVDVNRSENVMKEVVEAYDALVCAAKQVPDKGERYICQWIQLFNANDAQMKKYGDQILKLLEKKMSGGPQLQQSIDMPLYSRARQLYRQTEKPVLN